MSSGVVLATLCLNEMEHLPRLYKQHRYWPELKRWVFVESADVMYGYANPDRVSAKGLSVDGTGEFLKDLSRMDPRVVYVPYGFSSHPDPAQGKCASRSVYLAEADEVRPELVFVLDADEYYTRQDQLKILQRVRQFPEYTGFCFRHRHPWRPPSIARQGLFRWEVVGGFWDIPLCRGWRWQSGLRYWTNHNTPETKEGVLLDSRLIKLFSPNDPQCVHMAWTSNVGIRRAKNSYYKARGEGVRDHRGMYVKSREAYENWKPGDCLPGGAEIIPYTGPVPECFYER